MGGGGGYTKGDGPISHHSKIAVFDHGPTVNILAENANLFLIFRKSA